MWSWSRRNGAARNAILELPSLSEIGTLQGKVKMAPSSSGSLRRGPGAFPGGGSFRHYAANAEKWNDPMKYSLGGVTDAQPPPYPQPMAAGRCRCLRRCLGASTAAVDGWRGRPRGAGGGRRLKPDNQRLTAPTAPPRAPPAAEGKAGRERTWCHCSPSDREVLGSGFSTLACQLGRILPLSGGEF